VGADFHGSAMKLGRGYYNDRLNIFALRERFDAVVEMINLKLLGDRFRPIQVGIGDCDQLRFRNAVTEIISVLLAHRANANHTYAQLGHDRFNLLSVFDCD
jgi:hypothetical protein